MTDEERRLEEGMLQDLRTLMVDPRLFKVVENLADLSRLGDRIFVKIDPANFTSLQSWHPKMVKDFWGAIRYEFPSRLEQLTSPFKGITYGGWRWDLRGENGLGTEQARLAYAMKAALIGLTLDGMTLLLSYTDWAREPVGRLAECMEEAVADEVFGEIERLEHLGLHADPLGTIGKDRSDQKTEFKKYVNVAESVPFRLIRLVRRKILKEDGGGVLTPKRHFINELVDWEESLDWINVVPERPIVLDPTWKMGIAWKSCLRPFKKQDIRLDVAYVPDPDLTDRGRLRFPNLNVKAITSRSRTMSPPLGQTIQINLMRKIGEVDRGSECKDLRVNLEFLSVANTIEMWPGKWPYRMTTPVPTRMKNKGKV